MMPATTPTPSQVQALAARYGFDLQLDEVDAFRELMQGTLGSYAVVDGLTPPPRPVTHPRTPGRRPTPDENPYGAWAVRTSIVGTPGGLLEGRRVAIKDNTCVAGVAMANGSATLDGFVPEEDATVVRRLLDAGAEIVGKAVCEDLCFSGGSHTPVTGPVRNPWDTSRTSGGSSGGSAALLAAGEVDLALGGDQGGSVRMPSGFCGVVGLKPTWGLVPYTGAFPIEATIDTLGPMARTVGDVADMLQVIAGPDGDDPRQDPRLEVGDYRSGLDAGIAGLRVGIVSEGFGWPDVSEPRVDETVRTAALSLADAGAEVSEVSVPMHRDGVHVWTVIAVEGATTQMVDLNGSGMNWKGRYFPGMIAAFHAGRRAHANELAPTVKLVVLLGAHLLATHGGAYYAKAQNLAPALTAAYDTALSEVDVLAMPTLPMVAPPLPPADAPIVESVARALEMIPNTAPFSVTGHPAITVPAGLADGLPTGLMLIGRHGSEATLLAAAQAFEQLGGGFPSALTAEVA
jgi:amidase